MVTSLQHDAAVLGDAAGREGRAVPPVPHELVLALGYRHLQALHSRLRHVRVPVAELALLLRQARYAVAHHHAVAHPVVHRVAHQAAHPEATDKQRGFSLDRAWISIFGRRYKGL